MKKILFILLLATVLFSCNKQEYEFVEVKDLQTNKTHTFEYYDENLSIQDTVILEYTINSVNTIDKDIRIYSKYTTGIIPLDYQLNYPDSTVYVLYTKGIVINQY